MLQAGQDRKSLPLAILVVVEEILLGNAATTTCKVARALPREADDSDVAMAAAVAATAELQSQDSSS